MCLGWSFRVEAQLLGFRGRGLEGGDRGDIEAVASISMIQTEVIRVSEPDGLVEELVRRVEGAWCDLGFWRLSMVAMVGDEVVAWCGVSFTKALGRCRRTYWGRWVQNEISPPSWTHQPKDQLPPKPYTREHTHICSKFAHTQEQVHHNETL